MMIPDSDLVEIGEAFVDIIRRILGDVDVDIGMLDERVTALENAADITGV